MLKALLMRVLIIIFFLLPQKLNLEELAFAATDKAAACAN